MSRNGDYMMIATSQNVILVTTSGLHRLCDGMGKSHSAAMCHNSDMKSLASTQNQPCRKHGNRKGLKKSGKNI